MKSIKEYKSTMDCGNTDGWFVFKDGLDNWRITYLFSKHVDYGAAFVDEKELCLLESDMVFEFNKANIKKEEKKYFWNKFFLCAATIINIVITLFYIFVVK